jgi:hypothetical protein
LEQGLSRAFLDVPPCTFQSRIRQKRLADITDKIAQCGEKGRLKSFSKLSFWKCFVGFFITIEFHLSAHSLNSSAQHVLIILWSDDNLANITVLTNWNFSQMPDFTAGARLRAPLHPS